MKHKTLSTAALLLFAAATWAGVGADTGLAVDDSIITAKVKSALSKSPRPRPARSRSRPCMASVQLSGIVDSAESKQRAEVIAGTTEGVSDVHNFLKVRGAATTVGEKLDDSVLTTKVKAALVDNKTTRRAEIKVSALRGVVQLSGFVTSAEEKMEASKVAANVSGVKNVENDLEVRAL